MGFHCANRMVVLHICEAPHLGGNIDGDPIRASPCSFLQAPRLPPDVLHCFWKSSVWICCYVFNAYTFAYRAEMLFHAQALHYVQLTFTKIQYLSK